MVEIGRCVGWVGFARVGSALRAFTAFALLGLALGVAAQGNLKVQPLPQPGNVVSAVDEARVQRITAELRCLVCQNQTVADSNSDLANDLRREVRVMLARGASDEDVIDFMTARYGDFVLYRPPVKATTVLLWAGPAVLLLGGLLTLVLVLRRRQRLPDGAFEADSEWPGNDDGAPGARP